MPAFPVSVPREFYDEIAAGLGEPYADSYLFGASLHQGRLLPRTQTAWTRLRDSFVVREVLKKRGITLIMPPPFVPLSNARAA